ncbi:MULTISPECIES: molybdopterin-dependent oxidoreductase [Nocardia]|uniref:molybdopterin-dependent oxidoreductase n=1 Tax=Nocardia TaxID=1817 RepID=UPI000D68F307|nr:MULTISPECIES: molybdopterin-dependent oxidoreductase [Nocardia]
MARLWYRMAAGIVSAGLALGVAEVVAAFVGSETAPVQVLGSTVIDHTPGGLREWAIQTFGTSDKMVLYLCMAVVAILLAAFIGVVERGNRAIGSSVFAVFGVVTAVIAVEQHGVSAAFPTVVGVAVGIYALRVLTRRVEAYEDAVSDGGVASVSGAGEAGRGSLGTGESSAAAVGVVGTSVSGVGDSAGRGDTSANRARADSPEAWADPPEARADAARARADSVEAVEGDRLTPGDRTPASSVSTDRPQPTPHPALVPNGASALRRRQLLRGVAITGGVALVAGFGGRLLGSRRADVSGERAAVQLPEPVGPPISLAPEADLRLPGLTPYLTRNADFYRIDTELIVPQLSIEDWSLRIHGMVDREIVIRWTDLANRQAIERLVTLACVSNSVGGDLIGNAMWRGYRLDEMLAEAGPHPDADMVLSHSVDGWTASTPLSALTDGRDALLAVGMNGEPLPVSHGYPARMVVPGLYGYVSATKWVTELEVTRFDRAMAYWTKRWWSPYGPVKTGTRIDTPRANAKVSKGTVAIAGVAWAQHRGIGAVEVRIDGGPWQQAKLSADQSIDTWRQWVFEWNATPGSHTVIARATDGTGAIQTADRAGALPDGATGHPEITFTVR